MSKKYDMETVFTTQEEPLTEAEEQWGREKAGLPMDDSDVVVVQA